MKFTSEPKKMQRLNSLKVKDATYETDLAKEPYYFDDLTIHTANNILKTIKQVRYSNKFNPVVKSFFKLDVCLS